MYNVIPGPHSSKDARMKGKVNTAVFSPSDHKLTTLNIHGNAQSVFGRSVCMCVMCACVSV